jgi:DNA-binding NarL/FixJ family response regulator
MYRRDEYVFEAIKAGASGYLLKEVELYDLLAAIRAVARGEAVIAPAIAHRVLAEFRQPEKTKRPSESTLSERDEAILRLVAQGLSNQEIAERLFISEKTVRNRLSLVFQQLHLKNRTEAALYAIREGLIDPEESDEA